jgi:hypothetical protein
VWCPTTVLGTWTARQGFHVFLTGNSAFHWYDNGGILPVGMSMALNTTGRPETVIPGSNIGEKLDAMVAALNTLIYVGQAAPQAAANKFGGALSSTAHGATFRTRYPSNR